MDIEREIQLDFQRKLIAELKNINENMKEINTTLKRFGNYMPEPTHTELLMKLENIEK
jgi:hypothetical protein